MNGVSIRIKNGSDFQIHIRRVMPDVGHRHADEFGEGSGAVHADSDGILAQVPPSGEAVAATPADHVPFGTDDLAHIKVTDVGADRGHFAHEFMAHDHRHRNGFPSPCIPVENV